MVSNESILPIFTVEVIGIHNDLVILDKAGPVSTITVIPTIPSNDILTEENDYLVPLN